MASSDSPRAAAGRPLTASFGELAGADELDLDALSHDDEPSPELEPLPSFELPTERRVVTAA
ncbi:MAG: hypothetical protein ACMG6S_23670, partial [Byssovorax sp.]